MPLSFPQIDLPEMSVDPGALFSSSPPDPRTTWLLLSEFAVQKSPYFSGFPEVAAPADPESGLSERYRELGLFLLERYETDRYGAGRKAWTHAQQRQVLERAIRMLDKASQKAGGMQDKASSPGADVSLEMARAYLLRSRIIKPKGFTPPARKLEALNAAVDILNECKRPGAAFYRGVVALELDRCGEAPSDLLEVLEAAAAERPPADVPDEESAAFYQILIRAAEKGGSGFDAAQLDGLFELPPEEVPLERLKILLLSETPPAGEDLPEQQKRLVDILSAYPFSHPLWDETVRFLRRVHRWVKKNGGPNLPQVVRGRLPGFWNAFAGELWEAAEAQSRRLPDVHLRWYWSRQRDLYDLAFLAAHENADYQTAAKIADSAKGRAALTWQALERVGERKDSLRKIIEQYAQVLGGGYVKGMAFAGPEFEGVAAEIPASAPAGGRILQFYLVHLQDFERGYAVVCREDGWTKCPDFDFRPVWLAYQKWQSAYFGLPPQKRDQSYGLLRELCETMGVEMAFLFDFFGDGEEPANLLFVPHDFLHRIPLHGATRGEKTKRDPLFDGARCRYWPALSIPGRTPRPVSKSVRIQFFQPDDRQGKEFETDEFKEWFGEPLKGFSELMESKPDFLAVFCHGQADPQNPFRTRLKLQEDVTLLEINTSELDLSGLEILLGACETDTMAPIDSPLDEHLSVADVLLRKGAGRVIGTFWEARPEVIKKAIGQIYQKSGAERMEALRGLELSFFRKFNKGAERRLFHSLVFKIYENTVLQAEPESNP